jgi:GNAT superfamily N-acetyltransferase
LLSAFATIQRLLDPSAEPRPLVIRPLRAGDFGWVVHRHGALYAQEYGWDATFEALAARVVADYIQNRDPKREEAWIAELDEEPVGCVFCVKEDEEVARLRLLLVEPKARGMRIGSRLVDQCVRFSKGAGYKRLVLWTNDVLVSARRIYEAAGFRLASESPHHSFGHDLVEQDWVLDLDVK